MTHRKSPKLKPLLDKLPPGFLVDAAWLKKQGGIDPRSIHEYAVRGWLERVIHGVYRRPLPEGVRIPGQSDWQIPLLSLQWIMNMEVHLGGVSALEMAGFTHYLQFGEQRRVHLYGRVPSWLRRLPTKSQFVIHSRALFGKNPIGILDETRGTLFSPQMVEVWRWPLKVSSPERAALEALNEITTSSVSLVNLSKMFESLTSLRPNKLVPLLRECRSVKVRRLFFVLADYHQHTWRKHIDKSVIDFGNGPRALIKGGNLHPIYRICVPAKFIPASNSEHIEEWLVIGTTPKCLQFNPNSHRLSLVVALHGRRIPGSTSR